MAKSNDKLPFVKHHINNYGGQFPLWVIAELFTFGMLSYFYADMVSSDQKALARSNFKTSVSNAKSWLYCCTNLRNVCAHSRRLYNSVFSVIPANIKGIDKTAERKLFASVMAVRGLYPDKGKWNTEFVPPLSALFDEYEDIVLLRFVGFPEKWTDIVRM